MKIFIKVLVSIGLLAALGAMFIYARRSTQTQQVAPVQVDNSSQVSALLEEVASYYLDPTKKTYLKDVEIKATDFDQIRQSLDQLNVPTSEKQIVTAEIDRLLWKSQALELVNNLYQVPNGKVLVEDKLATDRTLKTTITKETLTKVRETYLDQEPRRPLNEDQNQTDEMVDTLKDLLTFAETQVDQFLQVKEALAKVEAIKIEDGQLGNIARGLREIETMQGKLTDKALTEAVDKAIDRYLNRFLGAFTRLAQEIPGYYEIAIVAVEPSKRLTDLLTQNQYSFMVTQTESQVEETIIIEYYEETEAWVPVETEPVTEAIVTEAPVQPDLTEESQVDTGDQ